MPRRFRHRLAIFLGIVAALIAGRSFPEIAAWPTALSPFVAVAALVGSVSLFGPGLIFAAPCLFRRRILCHTVCPMGFCFETFGKVRKKITGQNRLPHLLHRFPKLGVFLALFTWFGIGFGVIGFLWLDPFVLFASPFRSDNGEVSFLVFVTAVLLGTSWLLPTFWCRCFCPLGGTQDFLYEIGDLRKRPKKADAEKRKPRRRFLSRGIAFVFSGFLFVYLKRQTRLDASESSVRPPGAVDNAVFLALCARCAACIQACPTRLLRQADARNILEIGCPEVFHSTTAWCKHDCTDCSETCPTGAIRRFSVEDKKDFKLGRVGFEFERCRLYEDVECSICERECPYEAISYEWSEEEYRRIVVVDDERCTGCGRCAVACPVTREGDAGFPLKILPR